MLGDDAPEPDIETQIRDALAAEDINTRIENAVATAVATVNAGVPIPTPLPQ